MKNAKNNLVRFTILVLLAAAAITKAASANEIDELKCKNKAVAVKNLIEGIKSNNTGLMKSSVYFAGKYKIEETVPVLIERLKSKVEPECKILIALSLYQIGNEKGVEAIFKIAKNEKNNRVRLMFIAICTEFMNSKRNDTLAVQTGL
jgi:HEAT repeat protein